MSYGTYMTIDILHMYVYKCMYSVLVCMYIVDAQIVHSIISTAIKAPPIIL